MFTWTITKTTIHKKIKFSEENLKQIVHADTDDDLKKIFGKIYNADILKAEVCLEENKKNKPCGLNLSCSFLKYKKNKKRLIKHKILLGPKNNDQEVVSITTLMTPEQISDHYEILNKLWRHVVVHEIDPENDWAETLPSGQKYLIEKYDAFIKKYFGPEFTVKSVDWYSENSDNIGMIAGVCIECTMNKSFCLDLFGPSYLLKED